MKGCKPYTNVEMTRPGEYYVIFNYIISPPGPLNKYYIIIMVYFILGIGFYNFGKK